MAAEKGLAQDEHCPSLADYGQRPRDRAIHVLDRIPTHRRLSLSSRENSHATKFPNHARRPQISLHFETVIATGLNPGNLRVAEVLPVSRPAATDNQLQSETNLTEAF